MALAERVLQVYDFIAQYQAEFGQSPSVKEIAAAIDLGASGTSGLLATMEVTGMIERPVGKVRAIRLLKREANWNALIENQ